MSTTATLLQATANVQILPLLRGALGLSALAGFVLFFKPLLLGIFRALVLTVRPRRTKEERIARRQLLDARQFQRIINASQDPSQAAELRALSARA
ncbi:MAG: hypothetical protein V4693_22480 [Pseudomonadota bacterium]